MTDKPQDILKEETFKNVFECLLSSYEEERKKDPQWKELFAKVDGCNFEGILRECNNKMETLSLDVHGIIEDKASEGGVRLPRNIFNILQALPYVTRMLGRYISEHEGTSCCVDKTYFVLNNYINGKYNDR